MDIKEVLEKFAIDGNIDSVNAFGNGHINKSYKVITDTGEKYLFQSINGYAFKNVDDLMRNIYIVTSYLKVEGFETLEIVKTKNRKLYFKDDNTFYRVYKYVRKSITYEKLESPELVVKAAKAFGQLHRALEGLDSVLVAETINDFHNTPKRFENLMSAITEDPCDRLKDTDGLLGFVFTNRPYLRLIQEALDSGEIPERIVHNDPKINNVLFDRETNEIRCVIDLDTVMPGSCLYDFGDALRSIFTGDNESNRDTSVMKVDLNIYELYVKGYLESMNGSITKKEIELMPASIAVLALELGIRFLEDYIRGDKYFKITFEDENLVRAQGQFALAKDVIANLPKLKAITQKYID